jgi:dihydrofolate reductase
MFNNVTLDGFFEDSKHDMSWARHDQESNDFAEQQSGQAGTILFGRVTYEMMASYWPTPMALRDNPIVAGFMNNSQKFVFSKTLTKADWQNTRLVKGDAADEVIKMKQQPGTDMIIFGSGKLVSALTEKGLIDEYQFMVNPVILGSGTTLFKNVGHNVNLAYVRSQVLSNGNILLCYQLAK